MWFTAFDVEDAIAVECAVGTQQGCTHGSLLFSMAIQPVLRWLRGAVPFAVAIADDIVFRVSAEQAAAVLGELQRRLAELGSVLKLPKCEALSLHTDIPPELADMGLKCVGPDEPPERRGTDYLGAPVGTDEFRRLYLLQLAFKAAEDLKRLGEHMRLHLQCAMQLLRMCLLPRFNYQLRCSPPHVTLPAARAFDDALLEAVQTLLDTRFPPNHPAWQRVGLALCDGGLGLPRQADLAAAAWLAGCDDARELITALSADLAPIFDTSQPSLHAAADPNAAAAPSSSAAATAATAPTRQHTVAAYASLPATSQAELLAHQQLDAFHTGQQATASGGTGTRKSGLQSKLARPIHDHNRDTFWASIAAEPKSRAQHLSTRGWLGTAFLLAPPFGATAFASDELRDALITFLRLPWAPAVGLPCECGHALDAPDYPTDHTSACVRIECDSRHAALRQFVALLYKQLPGHGITVRAEQHIYGDAKRVDHVVSGVSGMNKLLATDHTIVDPTADTYVGAGTAPGSSANQANAAATKAYKEKMRDHTARIQNTQLGGLYDFMPVPIEVWGGVHESVVTRLTQWAHQLAEEELGVAANGSQVGQRRVQILAAQSLEGWRRLLSVGLVKARVQHLRSAVGACVARSAAAATFQGGAGCFLRIARHASARLRWQVGGYRDFRCGWRRIV